MDTLMYEVPDGGFSHGDVLMSKHHGRGVWHSKPRKKEGDNGCDCRQALPHFRADLNNGSIFTYSAGGLYFTEGAFKETECQLALVSRP